MTQSGNSCGQAGTGFAVVKTKNLGDAHSGTAAPLKPCPLPRSLTNPILFHFTPPCWFIKLNFGLWAMPVGKRSKPEQLPCPQLNAQTAKP